MDNKKTPVPTSGCFGFGTRAGRRYLLIDVLNAQILDDPLKCWIAGFEHHDTDVVQATFALVPRNTNGRCAFGGEKRLKADTLAVHTRNLVQTRRKWEVLCLCVGCLPDDDLVTHNSPCLSGHTGETSGGQFAFGDGRLVRLCTPDEHRKSDEACDTHLEHGLLLGRFGGFYHDPQEL